jgi:molybdopterin-guanine dinucleotide biosynthesis protein A
VIEIDAFILIGGRSTRMGRDKAFVEIDGEHLASRAARQVDAALSPTHITFVASSSEQFDAGLVFELGRPVVSDLKPGFGAWSGLHTALSYSRAEWTFAFACDLPFVTRDLLMLLVERIDADFNAVIPRQPDGRLQPLCACYRTRPALKTIDPLLLADRSLPPLASMPEVIRTRLVDSSEYASLPGADKFFHNVNTPEDVRVTS